MGGIWDFKSRGLGKYSSSGKQGNREIGVRIHKGEGEYGRGGVGSKGVGKLGIVESVLISF